MHNNNLMDVDHLIVAKPPLADMTNETGASFAFRPVKSSHSRRQSLDRKTPTTCTTTTSRPACLTSVGSTSTSVSVSYIVDQLHLISAVPQHRLPMLQNLQKSQRVKVVPGIVNVIAATKDQTITVKTSENQPLVIDLPAEMPTPLACFTHTAYCSAPWLPRES